MIVDPNAPQATPLTGYPGIKTSDQIVSEIHGAMAALPPEHQAAMDHGISMMKSGPSGPSAAPTIPPGETPTAIPGYYVRNGVPYQSSGSSAGTGSSVVLPEPIDSSIRFDGESGFNPVTAPDAPEKVGGIAMPEPRSKPEVSTSGIPGIVGVSSGDLARPAGPSDALPLPSGRSVSGRTAALESPRMMLPGSGGYEPLPHPPASPAATELNRLRDSSAGWHGIHNPILKGLAGIGDVFASGLFPQFAQFIPGTSTHHEALIDNKESQVGDEQKQQKDDDASKLAAANVEHLGAESTELASRPELKQAQNDLKGKDLELHRDHEESERQRKADAADASLRQHGFKRDEKTGQIVALLPEELSGPQRDIHDAKVAQEDLASARAELVRAQQAHIPAAEALARRRLESAQASHDIALERLGLSEKQYEARYHGTEGGKALPGALIADSGAPVGSAFQGNVRPTGQERNKADLANSAAEQISDIKGIVKNRPDIFGPVAGRKTDFTVWLGSQDPDAQRFKAARTIAADHLAGVFGGRSETALHALDAAIGQFKDNPEAVAAGLDQVIKGNSVFQKAGTVKTAGSNAAAGGKDAVPNVTTKDQFDALPKGAVYMEDGKKYRKP